MSVLQKQERFSRLQFPVHKLTAKTPVELFEILPGLRRYFQRLISDQIEYTDTNTKEKLKVSGYREKFRGIYPEDLTRIIKYIVFVYDPDSDIISEYPDDLKLQKEAAAKEAGFIRNKDGEWPLYVQDILEFREKQVVAWIIEYLKIKKNTIWMELKFIEEELDSLYRSRTAALLRGEIKSDSLKLIKERTEERDILIKRFYAEHSDLKQASQEELFPVSPENVFKELQIPPELWKVKQVRDVPKDTGVQETFN